MNFSKIFHFLNKVSLRYTFRNQIVKKNIIIASFAGFAGYFLSTNLTALRDVSCPISPIIFADASTNRSEQIKSLNFIADVVEAISPSVVSVTVGTTLIGTSFGSGFIVEDSGYIITNAHVVGRNSLVHVKLQNGQSFPGEVIAIDKSSDLALLKIEPGSVKLQPLLMADTSKLRPGEFVIALGSPMTLSNSVTVGVVSAVDRDLGHAKGLKYVQTDAIITVGNSGGPLVNLYGELVGVNTMMASTGFGFAIPSNHCREFVDIALNRRNPNLSSNLFSSVIFESKTRGKDGGRNKYLGVVMGSLTPQMASELSLMHPGYSIQPQFGVVIHSVFDMSPAHKSGLLPGDIVESVNGAPIHSPAEFSKSMSCLDSFDAVIIRRGRRFVLKNVTPEYD